MIAAMTAHAQDPAGWINPIVPQRADPHVFLHTDGYYYLTATAPEYDRIELRRARTLAGLAAAEVKTIWRKHNTGVMGNHIWAPEIHFIDGKWYIYFTAGDAEDKWRIRLYVLESASPNPLQGEWIERGQLKTNWESFTLDATTFAHRGRRYLVWTQNDNNKPPDAGPTHKGTHIYIALIDTPTSITGKQVMLTRPEFDWERRGHWVNEAPAVLIRHGKIFLTFSVSATDANYCLGLLTADEDADPLDPDAWTKSPQPVFKSAPATSQFGPGHNSFTTTPAGKTEIIIYHARNYEHIQGEPLNNPDRATRAQIIHWRNLGTPDVTPDFGDPVPDGPYPPK
jgi:GH43 family beta-xylosidase